MRLGCELGYRFWGIGGVLLWLDVWMAGSFVRPSGNIGN